MKKLFALALLASPSVLAGMPICKQYEAQVSVEVRAVTEKADSCLVEFDLDLTKSNQAFNMSSVCPLMLEDTFITRADNTVFTGFLVNRVANSPTTLANCGLAVGDMVGGVLVRKEADTAVTLDLGL